MYMSRTRIYTRRLSFPLFSTSLLRPQIDALLFPSHVLNALTQPSSVLRHRKRISIRQHRIIASKRLRAGANAHDPLALADALVLHEVVKEGVQIAGEVGHVGARAHEAEYRHRAVGALEEVELGVADGRRGDGRRARLGDGACAAERTQPDHHLVVVRPAVAGGEEDVVGDVRDDRGTGVAICNSCQPGCLGRLWVGWVIALTSTSSSSGCS